MPIEPPPAPLAAAELHAQRGRSHGFTLIEVLVVVVILGLLAAYFGQNIYGHSEDAKVATATAMVTQTIPAALQSYYTVNPAAANVTYQNLVDRGAPPRTPWGGKWYLASPTGPGQIGIGYPVSKDTAGEGVRNLRAILGKLLTEQGVAGIRDIAHTGYLYSIRPDFPMIESVQTKDLNKDGQSTIGLAVYYKVHANP